MLVYISRCRIAIIIKKIESRLIVRRLTKMSTDRVQTHAIKGKSTLKLLNNAKKKC